jgi:hypothetical protein
LKFLISVFVLCFVLGLAACGGGGSATTSEEASSSAADSAQIEALRLEKEKAEFEAQAAEAEAKSQKREAARAAQDASETAAAPEAESVPEKAPDVVGLRLPQAEAALRAAGYETNAENTDTTFGIVVPSHYTVCEQDEPQGSLVTVLAQKYGC